MPSLCGAVAGLLVLVALGVVLYHRLPQLAQFSQLAWGPRDQLHDDTPVQQRDAHRNAKQPAPPAPPAPPAAMAAGLCRNSAQVRLRVVEGGSAGCLAQHAALCWLCSLCGTDAVCGCCTYCCPCCHALHVAESRGPLAAFAAGQNASRCSCDCAAPLTGLHRGMWLVCSAAPLTGLFNAVPCVHLQGPELVADDRGYVCNMTSVDTHGCCPVRGGQ